MKGQVLWRNIGIFKLLPRKRQKSKITSTFFSSKLSSFLFFLNLPFGFLSCFVKTVVCFCFFKKSLPLPLDIKWNAPKGIELTNQQPTKLSLIEPPPPGNYICVTGVAPLPHLLKKNAGVFPWKIYPPPPYFSIGIGRCLWQYWTVVYDSISSVSESAGICDSIWQLFMTVSSRPLAYFLTSRPPPPQDIF